MSLLLDVLGRSLTTIRDQDRATNADLGAVLGKSEDRVAAYRNGDADMGVVSFLRGCREWDGRFANDVLAIVGMKLVPIETHGPCDQAAVTTFLRLTAELSADLEEDGDISDADLADNAALIERVGRLVDGYRERLRSRHFALLNPPDTS
ncbi:hypothetical protein [Sphingomonas sp. Leaf343]|uniref:hypothetical protein n=1 Tax=Sphingomonas sp. Leaf343 TaxID=1736345 RepID=UPI001F1C2B43|nr:hypothetical protein [Sphingomonas sp. Leaf343]